jgi:hypothetical protein
MTGRQGEQHPYNSGSSCGLFMVGGPLFKSSLAVMIKCINDMFCNIIGWTNNRAAFN